MTTAQKIRQITRRAELQLDSDILQTAIEELGSPEYAADYCDCCDRPLDEFGCCEHCFYLADMLGNL